MKKIVLLILVTSVTLLGLQAKVWNFSNPPFGASPTVSFSSTFTTPDGLTVGTNNTVLWTGLTTSAKTIDGISYSYRLQTGGGGAPLLTSLIPTTRYLKFDVNPFDTINIGCMSSSSTATRTLIIVNSDQSVKDSIVNISGTVAATYTYVYKGITSSVYLYSRASGINYYYLSQKVKTVSVSTQEATLITSVGATLNGTILQEAITLNPAHGFCWNTTGNPSLMDNFVDNGPYSGLQSYLANINNLNPNTKYYVRSYITNSDGVTIYGNEVNFITAPSTPTLSTQAATSISSNSATLNGTVVTLGNNAITAYGFCWNKSGYPTVTDSVTNKGNCSITGTYTDNVSGLTSGTIYFLRAYATTSDGTTLYGSEVSFTTTSVASSPLLLKEEFDYPAGTDLFGQGSWAVNSVATPTIKVSPSTISYPGYPSSGTGNEVMLSNSGQDLNKSFAAQTSGTVYASFLVKALTATTAGDYFFHVGANVIGTSYFGRIFAKTNAAGKLAFGILYTSGGTITPTYSDFVYDLNTTYLIVLKYAINGAASNTSIVINPALTSTEPLSGWFTDAQGTSAKPANIGSVALRQGTATTAGTFLVDGIHVALSWADVFNGLMPSGSPSINTLPATSITTSSVTLNGSVFSLGNSPVTSYGFCWNRTGSPTLTDNFIDKGACTTTGDFTHSLSGLIPEVKYYVKTFATNSLGTIYGNEQVFTLKDAFEIITNPVSVVLSTSVVLNCNINILQPTSIIAHGFCWNTTGSPTLVNTKTDMGTITGSGLFTGSVTGLLPRTMYYVKAYATDSIKTIFGNEVSFVTLSDAISSDSLILNLQNAGTLNTLLSASEKTTLKKLTITGNIDARDFKTMRDNMPALTDINLGGAFILAYNGAEGTSTLPGSVNYNGYQIPTYAFYNDSTLHSIILPTSLTSIGSYAFYNCKTLKQLDMPQGVSSISSNSLYYCSALVNINPLSPGNFSSMDGVLFDKTLAQLIHMPTSKSGTYSIPSVTTRIGSSAFIGCNLLTGITIPISVITISSSAFNGCSGLNSIKVENPVPVIITSDVFAGVDTVNCVLKVPVGKVIPYRAANYWKAFNRIIADGFAVTTQAATGITQTSSKLHGTIEDMGLNPVSAHGFCWNTIGAPTINDSKTNKGTPLMAGAYADSITGLQANTKYFVKAYATSSTETVYGSEITFSTNYNPVSLPLFENFDASASLPEHWKSTVTSGSTVYINNWNSFSQPNHVSMNSTSGFAMLTMPLPNASLNTLKLNFKAFSYGSSRLQVGTVSDPSNVYSFNLIDSVSMTNLWNDYTVNFNNYRGTDTYIAFRYTGSLSEAFIDDVLLKVAPACEEPTGLAYTSIEAKTATLNWKENGSATQWEYVYSIHALNPDTVKIKSTTATHPFQLTELLSDTTYLVYVRSVCGNGGYSEWSIPLSFKTAASCFQPTNLISINQTPTSSVLGWSTPGSATQWELEYGISGFSKGTGTVVSTSTNPYTLTGLSASSRYQYYVRTVCGVGDSSRWSGPYSFDTQCGTKNLPIIENFDGSNSLPPCWTPAYKAGNMGNGNIQIVNWNNYYSAPNSVSIYVFGGYDMLTLPQPNANLNTLKLKFKAVIPMQGSLSKIQIGTVSNPDSVRTFHPVDSMTISGTMTDYTVFFNKYAGTDSYIAFRYGDGLNYGNILIDNVALEVASECSEPSKLMTSGIQARTVTLNWQENGTATQWHYKYGVSGFNPDSTSNYLVANSNPFQITGLNPEITYQVYIRSVCGSSYSGWSAPVSFTTLPSCLQPTDLTVKNITLSSADLSWTDPGSASQWSVEYGVSGFMQGTGTVVTANTNPYTLSGLNSSTRYQYYVRSNCGVGDNSRWCGPFTFDTQCGSKNLPIAETFEGLNSLPPCWTSAFTAGAMGTGSVQIGSWYFNNANYNAVMLNVSTGYTMLTLPQPNSNLNILKLKFKAIVPMTMSPSKLLIGTVSNPTDVTTFHQLDSVTLNGNMSDYTVFFNKYTGLDPYIAFKYGDGMNYGSLVIDDVMLETTSTCLEPSNPVASAIGAKTVTLNWHENGSAVNWQYKFGLQGFNPDSTGTTGETGINPMTISVLNPETNYQVYVRSVCGTAYSDWSVPVSFTTLPSCLQPTDLTVKNITLTSADLAWTNPGSASQWSVEYGASGFMQGTGTVVTANTTPYTLTGLNASSRYQYYVRSNCGAGDNSHWSGPFTFDTQCDAKNLPIIENFDGSNTIPPCWIAALKAGNMGIGNIQIANWYNYYSAPNSVNINVNGGYAMLTMPMPNANLNTLKLKFKAVVPMAGFISKIQIGTVSNPDSVATFHLVDSVALSGTMSDYTVYFNKYSGTDSYIAFKYGDGYNFGNVMIDNVSLEISLNAFAILASVNPLNSGLITGTGNYNPGSNVTLTASPTFGYKFINWTENGTVVSTDLIFSSTVDRSRNLVANFQTDATDIWNTSSRFSIYPNPVRNELIIEYDGFARYEIISMTGQVVYSGNLIKNVSLQTNKLIPGIYIVKLSTVNSTVFRKVVKE